jgi:hypothetical protein
MDKYKVETIRYEYNYVDVGPGPSMRADISHMSSAVRNYRKTYTLEEAVKEFEKRWKKLHKEYDVVIISKFVTKNKEYVPGKVTIDMNGEPTWSSSISRYFTFTWKRNKHSRVPYFSIRSDGKPVIVRQDWFFKKEKTFHELLSSAMFAGLYDPKTLDQMISNSPMMSLYRSFKASQRKEPKFKYVCKDCGWVFRSKVSIENVWMLCHRGCLRAKPRLGQMKWAKSVITNEMIKEDSHG